MAITQDQLVSTLLRCHDSVVGYIWLIVQDDHLAEDIYQEVSLIALRKREQIADERALPAWLRAAGRREALALLRRTSRHPRVFEPQVIDRLEQHWARHDHEDHAAKMEALRLCLEQLSSNAREMIRLRYGMKLKPAQIATRLNRRVQTIYVAITRAHKILGDCVRRRLKLVSHD